MYAYVEIQQVRRLVFDNILPIVSSVYNTHEKQAQLHSTHDDYESALLALTPCSQKLTGSSWTTFRLFLLSFRLKKPARSEGAFCHTRQYSRVTAAICECKNVVPYLGENVINILAALAWP